MLSPRERGTSNDPLDEPGSPGWRGHKPMVPTFVEPKVNKLIRTKLLRQHWATNRFQGTAEANHAEREFQAFISRYQLRRVRRRLLLTAVPLLLTLVNPGPSDVWGTSRALPFFTLYTILPVALLWIGAALCYIRRTRGHWRLCVMASLLLAYNSVIWADLILDLTAWTPCQMNYNTMWQLVWLLMVMQLSALFYALDLVHLFGLLLAEWISYVASSITLHFRWQAGYDKSDHSALITLNTTTIEHANGTVISTYTRWDEAGATDAATGQELTPRILYECLILSTLAMLVLLVTVRRLDRFERQSFVNSYVLLHKVSRQAGQISGKQVELLALFSNPAVPRNGPLQLRPLALGQELKFLLRKVPKIHMSVEPAATLEDVEQAIKAHNPRILLFSGHSFMGSLAFELPNGRIDLPPPDLFIKQLAKDNAPRLQAVFLNGCHTAALAHQIVSQLPYIMCISWCTITEDAAARAFAEGFYDAVGAYISDGESVQIEEAFWAGLDNFSSQAFRLGDPAVYLHPPGHPHTVRPVLVGCEGCCPPVHGMVSLFRNNEGVVERLVIEAGQSGAESLASASGSHLSSSDRRPSSSAENSSSRRDSGSTCCSPNVSLPRSSSSLPPAAAKGPPGLGLQKSKGPPGLGLQPSGGEGLLLTIKRISSGWAEKAKATGSARDLLARMGSFTREEPSAEAKAADVQRWAPVTLDDVRNGVLLRMTETPNTSYRSEAGRSEAAPTPPRRPSRKKRGSEPGREWGAEPAGAAEPIADHAAEPDRCSDIDEGTEPSSPRKPRGVQSGPPAGAPAATLAVLVQKGE